MSRALRSSILLSGLLVAACVGPHATTPDAASRSTIGDVGRAVGTAGPEDQVAAAEEATVFAAEAQRSLPELVAGLSEPDLHARRRAAEAVEDVVGSKDGHFAANLAVRLEEPDPFVRERLARALLRMGPQGKAALEDAAREDPDLRDIVHRLLPVPEPEDRPVKGGELVTDLETGTSYEWVEIREGSTVERGLGIPNRIAGRPLRASSNETAPHAVFLRTRAQEERVRERAKARAALRHRIAAAKAGGLAGARELVAMLSKEHASLARDGLLELGGGADSVVPELTQLVETGSRQARSLALEVLAKRGPAAAEAVPAIARWLQEDSDCGVQREAAATLKLLGPVAAPATDALVATFEGPCPLPRLQALQALGQIGPDADRAVPALIRALETDSVTVHSLMLQRMVARVLGRIGPAAAAAAPVLEAKLDAEDPKLRTRAALVLIQIGFSQERALDVLVGILGGKVLDREVRGALVSAGPVAVPLLELAVSDPARHRAAWSVIREIEQRSALLDGAQ